MSKDLWKVSTAIWEEIFVHDANGAGVTGLNVTNDFTKLLTKDGSSQSSAGVTIAEVANGRYSITWTPGSTGQWDLTVIQASNKIVAKFSYYVTTDGPLSKADIQTDILAKLPAALVGGRMDSSIGAVQNNAIPEAGFANGAISDRVLAADVDTYQAKVGVADDDAGVNDRYTVVWLKNGQPVLSGVTVPTIQVIKVADGTDLIPSTSLTEVGSTHIFRKNEGTNRIVAGAMYIAHVEATIDGSNRKWRQQFSRDSA